ncbi:MAG: SDR family oxidoreductase [Anaerolineales bacterium]|nr:MAG: SDR family oxidoreductase [Anaerolineales bacterium]
MDLGLKDRVALIAASSRGLGRACAHTLSAEEAKVAICARDDKTLRATADEIARDTGNQVLAIVADLTSARDCRRVVQETIDFFGGLHVLVTNNGGPAAGYFFDFDDNEWYRTVDLTLMSAVRLIRAAVPQMREQKWGRIINITSVSVKEPLDNLILSNSVRAGVIGMARTLANQLAAEGITVNNVLPGHILTGRVIELAENQARAQGKSPDEVLASFAASIPVGRVGKPEELAALVAFLASEQAAYINGTSILVDGGRYKGLM